MLCNICIISNNPAMQTFVEQQVGAGVDFLPRGKFARLLAKGFGFFFAVQVVTAFAGTGLAV